MHLQLERDAFGALVMTDAVSRERAVVGPDACPSAQRVRGWEHLAGRCRWPRARLDRSDRRTAAGCARADSGRARSATSHCKCFELTASGARPFLEIGICRRSGTKPDLSLRSRSSVAAREQCGGDGLANGPGRRTLGSHPGAGSQSGIGDIVQSVFLSPKAATASSWMGPQAGRHAAVSQMNEVAKEHHDHERE